MSFSKQHSRPSGEADCETIRTWLDEAVGDLNEGANAAVALYFFENRQFSEIATRLDIPEQKARDYVDRALDELSLALLRRRVTLTPAALAFALAGQASRVAPKGFAESVIATSLAVGGARSK